MFVFVFSSDTTLADSSENVFKISISQSDIDTYGMRYPITYTFNIPSYDGINCYRKNTTSANWIELTEKSSSNAHGPTTVVNGEEIVRFDYSNDTAYVSIGFPVEQNYTYIKFENPNGVNIVDSCSYDGIPLYYDNRKAAVTMTWDDWNDGTNADFCHAANITSVRNIWASPGCITRNGYWNDPQPDTNWEQDTWDWLQHYVTNKTIDPASHTRTHPHLANGGEYTTLEYEINGSKHDIIENLTLPYGQFVFAFLYPYGSDSESAHEACGDYYYLVARDIYTHSSSTDFSSWDAVKNIYAKTEADRRFGSDGHGTMPSTFNSAFDSAYDTNGIYHLMSHPWKIDDDGAWGNFETHCDYIANHTDVWYVGYGLMYLYHYADNQAGISVSSTTIDATSATVPVFQSINSQANNTVLQDQNRTFKWNIVSGATNYSIRVSNYSDFHAEIFLQLDNISLAEWGATYYSEADGNVTFILPDQYNITFYGYHYYQVRAYTT